MADMRRTAQELLAEFKGDSYLFGAGVLSRIGETAKTLGSRPILIRDVFPGSERFVATIRRSLEEAGLQLAAEIDGAGPNCPMEDLYRIAGKVKETNPDLIISFGGGSTIDAAKAAEVLRTLGRDIDEYFGTGLVTEKVKASGKKLAPHIAIQTAASSGAHLTKYSNITNVQTGQKKLIVDEAVVPTHPVFDYEVTYGAPKSLTADGALDGIAHCLEVFYGATGKPWFDKMKRVAQTGIALVVEYLPRVMQDPKDTAARDAICLATDMGGYAIMIGGTNGGHLTSFSLVDVMPHGRACALMNPYYTVFFAPSIEEQLRTVGAIFKERGFIDADLNALAGRELGIAVARGMLEFQSRIGYPVKLSDVQGFTDGHIDRALSAAKDPQLAMKLQNMPIPMNAEMIDEYMAPILRAAASGNLEDVKTA